MKDIDSGSPASVSEEEDSRFPFTRGIHPTMYRGKLWTMRRFSGFGTPEENNLRFKCLLSHGQTGLLVAFDLPTLMGLDSDNPLCQGEVGRCGVDGISQPGSSTEEISRFLKERIKFD